MFNTLEIFKSVELIFKLLCSFCNKVLLLIFLILFYINKRKLLEENMMLFGGYFIIYKKPLFNLKIIIIIKLMLVRIKVKFLQIKCNFKNKNNRDFNLTSFKAILLVSCKVTCKFNLNKNFKILYNKKY